MNTSLRDQLLAAGLINQKQARDAERQQQHQQREQQHRGQQHAKRQRPPPGPPAGAAARGTGTPRAGTPGPISALGALPLAGATASAQSAKVARDLALNRQHHERAEKKARAAQVKQLIEQNRLPRAQTEERYNFLDGSSVRCITVDAPVRSGLMRGELVIVRHEGRYEVVTAAVGARIRERDERAVVERPPAAPGEPVGEPVDEAYRDHPVPDDLRW